MDEDMAKVTQTAEPSTKKDSGSKAGGTEKLAKKPKSAKPAKAEKPSLFKRLSNYLRDVRTELRRTVWPSRDEVIRSSFVVVVTLAFFIVFLVIVDFLVSNAILFITNIAG
jgi:preprotein translocase subunit SecE